MKRGYGLPDDAPDHLGDYEVPYRRVDHQHGDEDYWSPDESFPGQLPLGHAKTDFHGLATPEDKRRWRKEDIERERRRVRLGFRSEPLP